MREFILYTRGPSHPRVSYNLHKAQQHTFKFLYSYLSRWYNITSHFYECYSSVQVIE